MAYRGYKVVAFTPAGRERVMSILINNLERFRPLLDEYQVWLNTDKEQVKDTRWLKSLPDMYDWIKLIKRPIKKPYSPKQMNTGLFYPNTTDEKTIYIRFDDDIVYIDDNFFKNMLDFRIDNPDYFLVFANIWNNAIMSYIHQQNGAIPPVPVIDEPYCMNPIAWRSGKFAENLHEIILDHIEQGTTDKLYFGKADLVDATRFSISCFSFFGKDFKKFKGIVGFQNDELKWDEEVWLTEVYPILFDAKNTICGSALVSHYSFFAQRPHLDKTDILQRYKRISQQKLSDEYYELLDLANEQEKGKTKTSKTSKAKSAYPDFKLPHVEGYKSFTIEALEAEKEGFLPVKIDNGWEIRKDGQTLAKLSGEVFGRQLDEMAVRVRRKYKKNQPTLL